MQAATRDVSKSSTVVSGGQCVTTAGHSLTHTWCADSLVTGNVKRSYIQTHPCSMIVYEMCVHVCLPYRSGETLLSEGLDITSVPRFGLGSGPIVLDDVSCTGKEPGLLLCKRREWLRHDCTHHEDVNIACSPERSGESLPLSKKASYVLYIKKVADCGRGSVLVM